MPVPLTSTVQRARPVLLDEHGRNLLDQEQDKNPAPDAYDPGMALPHVLTFSGLLRGASHTYFREMWDEAMRHSRENAMAMRRDEHLQACLRERIRGTTSLKWHLEPDNPKDPWQKAAASGAERVIRGVHRLKRTMKQSMQALWYGRYGTQIQWAWKMMPLPQQNGLDAPTRALTVKRHIPLNGDKIDWTWDHTPTVRINSARASNYPDGDLVLDNLGYSLKLGPAYRHRFLIHTWEPDDGDFYDPERGSAIHGAGIRDWLYWSWWTKQEYMTSVVDALERFGLGIVVIYFTSGNTQEEEEAKKAAKNYSRRSVLVIPRSPAAGHAAGIEVIQTPVAGMEVLLNLQRACEEREERFIIAQTLSSDHRGSGGLGGGGAADFERETKWDVIEDDSQELAETLTGSDVEPGLVSMVAKFTYPYVDFPIRWVFDLDPNESEQKMGNIAQAWNMGGRFAEKDLHKLCGTGAPGPDEVVLRNPAIVQAEQQQQMMAQQMQQQQAMAQQPEPAGSGDPVFDQMFEGGPGAETPKPGGIANGKANGALAHA